jgi:putative oxidoreductase
MRGLLSTRPPGAVILVRALVGAVFLSEGIQKFLFPAELGPGRFARIGLPAPGVLAPFVGTVEIVGGALILLGLLTRPAAAVLLINISVALVSTKLPILLGHAVGPFAVPKLASYGFWACAHEARTDVCMALGCVFLIVVGAGAWSLDALLTRPKAPVP